MDSTKFWLEGCFGQHNGHKYGMSSAAGCTLNDLPTDGVPAGSLALDYTTLAVHTFDGVSWK